MSGEESSETTSMIDESWVSWFCNLSGNNVLCEVDKQFMEDSFNLFGLKQHVTKDFNKALYTILDRQEGEDEDSEEDVILSSSLLYGMIHARFIITTNGLLAMQKKYKRKEFGECPRTYCNGQAVLPVGMADEPNLGSFKLFCPKCRDLFNCSASQSHVDGAYFGTSFPHIFLMTYEDLVPSAPTGGYVPRVFGFKVHPSSGSLPKKVVVLDGQSTSEGASSNELLNVASGGESEVEATGSVPAAHGSQNNVTSRSGISRAVVYDLTSDQIISHSASNGEHRNVVGQQQQSAQSGSTTYSATSNSNQQYNHQQQQQYQPQYEQQQPQYQLQSYQQQQQPQYQQQQRNDYNNGDQYYESMGMGRVDNSQQGQQHGQQQGQGQYQQQQGQYSYDQQQPQQMQQQPQYAQYSQYNSQQYQGQGQGHGQNQGQQYGAHAPRQQQQQQQGNGNSNGNGNCQQHESYQSYQQPPQQPPQLQGSGVRGADHIQLYDQQEPAKRPRTQM